MCLPAHLLGSYIVPYYLGLTSLWLIKNKCPSKTYIGLQCVNNLHWQSRYVSCTLYTTHCDGLMLGQSWRHCPCINPVYWTLAERIGYWYLFNIVVGYLTTICSVHVHVYYQRGWSLCSRYSIWVEGEGGNYPFTPHYKSKKYMFLLGDQFFSKSRRCSLLHF